jgi:hypothetical protein
MQYCDSNEILAAEEKTPPKKLKENFVSLIFKYGSTG